MFVIPECEFRDNANFFIDRCINCKSSILITCDNGERLVLKNLSYSLEGEIARLKEIEDEMAERDQI